MTPDENQGSENAGVQMIFYNISTLFEMQRISIDMEGFEVGTVVNERGFEPDTSDEEDEEEEEGDDDGDGDEEEESKDDEAEAGNKAD